MTERVIVGLECQVPYENKKAFDAFLGFVTEFNPTRIVSVGDILDCPAPARWNRGTAAEYATNLQQEIKTVQEMYGKLRGVYDGKLDQILGNHEARIEAYTQMKAPAFADLDCLTIPELLDYQSYDINPLPAFSKLAPGWLVTHGHLPGTISKYAGGTAMGIARRQGQSVVCGHTHRLGHIQESTTVGARRTLHGVETGHMMDVRKASYIKDGAPNWQSGWAAFEIEKDSVHCHLVSCSPSGKLNWTGTGG